MISRLIESGSVGAGSGAGDQVVARIRSSLATRIGEDCVTRYFGERVRLAYAPGRLDVRTPTTFMANLLGRRFGGALRDAAAAATGAASIDLAFGVDPVESPAAAPRGTRAAHEPGRARTPARRTAGSAARQYTLNDFVVGPTNQLAYDAACRFAEGRGAHGRRAQRSSPATLFLHGICGLGKTHLLHGIAGRFLENNPGAVVRVVTGEAFTNEFIAAVQSGRGAARAGERGPTTGLDRFRRSYRRVDLLCIDDVHFLTSKAATQSELLHTFDELDLSGASIVLASDEHPRQVKKFSDALVSRFMSGLVTRIDPPDQVLCSRLIEAMGRRRGLAMDEGVIRAIVARIAPIVDAKAPNALASRTVSVRDIEGLMTRIEAFSNLSQTASDVLPSPLRRVGLVAVQQAFGQQWGGDGPSSGATGVAERRAPAPVVVNKPGQAGRSLKLEQITSHVCRVLGVEFDELAGNGRRPQVVLARSLISRLARRLTTLSFPEIARGIGRPTHSTIIAACQRLEAMMALDAQPTIDLGGTILTVKELCERLEGELATSAG